MAQLYKMTLYVCDLEDDLSLNEIKTLIKQDALAVANFGHRRWGDMKQNIMKMTNIIIEFLLNSEEENFIDMILTHIRDGIPFDEEEIKEWNDE